MGCVGDGLVTVELSSCSDVVIEDPEPAPDTLYCKQLTTSKQRLLYSHLTELNSLVETGDILRQRKLGWRTNLWRITRPLCRQAGFCLLV